MFKVKSFFNTEIIECQTMHEAFSTLEKMVQSKLTEQLEQMRVLGDPAANHEQCQMLLQKAIRRMFHIELPSTLHLSCADSAAYWLFDGLPNEKRF